MDYYTYCLPCRTSAPRAGRKERFLLQQLGSERIALFGGVLGTVISELVGIIFNLYVLQMNFSIFIVNFGVYFAVRIHQCKELSVVDMTLFTALSGSFF